MRRYRFSNRIAGCLAAAATLLWLIPVESFAGVPRRPAGAKVQANTHAVDPPNCTNDLGNPGVYPPCSSYGEWTAKWWKWILSIPYPVNPNFDPTGEHCAQGQAGPVWFLPGSFDLGGSSSRACVVPQGKATLLPLPNAAFGAGLADCSSPGWGNPDPCDKADGTSVKELRAGAAAFVDTATLLEVSIDGVPLQNLFQYRFQSPVFSYSLPSDNILRVLFQFPVPAGTYAPALSDGYWVMFKPLAPGIHDIHVKHIYFGIEGEGTWRLIVR